MKDSERVIGLAKKYEKLAWEVIGGSLLIFAGCAAFLIYYDFTWERFGILMFIIAWVGCVPLFWGIRHLLMPNVLIVTDEEYIYMVHTKRRVDKIPMQDVESIYPTPEGRVVDDHFGGIQITTHDGQKYVRDRIMYRYALIQAIADQIYVLTGNTVNYYALENPDGSDVY